MSTFTDPATGKTYQMNPLTGGYTEVPGASPSVKPGAGSQDFLRDFVGRTRKAVTEAPAQLRQTATSLRQQYPQAGLDRDWETKSRKKSCEPAPGTSV